MAEQSVDDFFTPRHSRLTRIATFADLGAWLALIVNFIFVVVFVINVNLSIQSSTTAAPGYSGLAYQLLHDPIYAASFAVTLLNALLRGGVYFLVLKSVAVGLRMIVDTNLNIIEKREAPRASGQATQNDIDNFKKGEGHE